MDENGRRRQGTLAVGLATAAAAAALGEGHKNNVISQSLGVGRTNESERASECRFIL